MNIIQATLLGIVEGITEFLPISSTAHMVIVEQWLNITLTEYVKTFTISIQLGAILSVIIFSWHKIFADQEIWKKILLAFLPTGIIGFIFYKLIKNFLIENINIIIWSLIIGGVILIIFELVNYKNKKMSGPADLDSISYGKALAIGTFQALGMIPGVSRSAATIVGGLTMGINRQTVVIFSFLLAIPTMLAATVYDLYKTGLNFSAQEIEVWLFGFLTSFIVATIAIKFLINFIKNHTFIIFGIYRIILGLTLLAVLM